MSLVESLELLGKRFSVAIYSSERPYFDVLIDTILYFLKKRNNQLVCLTLEHGAYDIQTRLGKEGIEEGIFFVDPVSVMNDKGLPYGDFDLINNPELVDDMWVSILVNVREARKKGETTVIFYYISELVKYIGIDNALFFLNAVLKQLKEQGINTVLVTGVKDDSLQKTIFNGLVNKIIYV